MEAAVLILRKTLGIKQGEKGATRTASEGSIFAKISANGRIGGIVELNSETDFVARNDNFKTIGRTLVEKVLSFPAGTVPKSLEDFLNTPHESGTVSSFVTDTAATIGEKVAASRFERFGAPEGNVVGAYVHNPGGSGDEGGKIGVLVEVTGADPAALATLARELALHVASANPMYLKEDDVEAGIIEREREVARGQAANDPKMQGKPEKAIESLVNGRVRKFLEESVLLNQAYVKDPGKTVAAFVNETKGADVVRFVRFRVGETQAAAAEAESGEGASS
jgi:elongation factor Ts